MFYCKNSSSIYAHKILFLYRIWGEEVNSAGKKKREPKLWKALWRVFGFSVLKYAVHSFICDVAIK